MADASISEFKLICPRNGEIQRYSDVTLSCHLSSETTAVAMEIRWFKGTDCVCLYKNEQVTEGRGYEGRVSLSTQELQRGNVSLQLRDFRKSDTGDYLCQVTSGDRTEELTVELDWDPSKYERHLQRHLGFAFQHHLQHHLQQHLQRVLNLQQHLHLPYIFKSDRKWTEEERTKMEESALLIELKEEKLPGPVLKNIMNLMERRKAWEDQLKEDETELEQTAQHTPSKGEELEEDEISEISVEIREMQERLVRERVEMRQREEQEMRDRMRTVVETLRNSVEKLMERIKQHEQQKHECEQNLSKERNDEMRRKLERELEREDQQMKETQDELKRMQEERRQMVKNHRLEMRSREKSAAVADRQLLFRNLPACITQNLLTKKQNEFDRRMEEKHRELKTLKLNLSEMEKDKEKQLEERKKILEEKNKEVIQKDTELEEHLKTIENQNKIINEKNELVQEKERLVENTEKEVETSKRGMEALEKELQEKDRLLKENSKTLQLKDETLEAKDTLLREIKDELEERTIKLEENQRELEVKDSQLENMSKLLSERERLLENTVREGETSKSQLETLRKELQDKNSQLQEMMILLEQQKTELAEKDNQLEEKDRQVEEKDRHLEERRTQLQESPDPDSSVPVRRRNSKEVNPPNMSGETPHSAAPPRRRNSMEGLPPQLGVESPCPGSPVPVAELRLVLLGRTGSGKSAVGNTILGRKERSQAGTSTKTQQSERRQGEVAGRKVTVVDTPDWFCPELSLEEVRQDVGLCVRLSAPGPHAFLLVIPVKQDAGEERGMLEKMEDIFGERCCRNTMILFTFTDKETNPEQLIQSGTQEVQTLVKKCGNRFHCLNIKEIGDGSQVSELLEKIEKMVEGNRDRFYSSEIYLETESQIREMERKIMNERKEKKASEEREIREKLEKEVQHSLRKIEGVIQEHEGDIRQLHDRTADLERRIKEEIDEEKKRELERELEKEAERRTEMEEKVKKLKEKKEKERREMEERHKQQMAEIMETYDGEARMEAERNLMKIILPELQRNILVSKSKMQEEFSRQMEEKDTDLETLKQQLSEIKETHALLEEVYERTLRNSSDSERTATPAEGGAKGFSQKVKGLFHS